MLPSFPLPPEKEDCSILSSCPALSSVDSKE